MATDLKSRIQADLNEARKQRDKARTLVLSTVLSELKNREIDSKATLDDDGALRVISKAIKQRQDASEQMREAGRPELADREDGQVAILKVYLPQQLSEEEVREAIREIVSGGTSQMGAVMGQLMPRIRGRFDGKEANRIVREELGA